MGTVIFGGSFDPIHIGHITMVSYLLGEPDVDRVLVIPAACSPFKSGKKICPNVHRLEMCKIAFEGTDGVEISDIEFSLSVPSFTVNTLGALKKAGREDITGMLVGGDSVMGLCRWKDWESIVKSVRIYASVRETADRAKIEKELERLGADYRIISMPKIDISSTRIRNRLKNRLSCGGLLPEGVERYIIDNHLYT